MWAKLKESVSVVSVYGISLLGNSDLRRHWWQDMAIPVLLDEKHHNNPKLVLQSYSSLLYLHARHTKLHMTTLHESLHMAHFL